VHQQPGFVHCSTLARNVHAQNFVKNNNIPNKQLSALPEREFQRHKRQAFIGVRAGLLAQLQRSVRKSQNTSAVDECCRRRYRSKAAEVRCCAELDWTDSLHDAAAPAPRSEPGVHQIHLYGQVRRLQALRNLRRSQQIDIGHGPT